MWHLPPHTCWNPSFERIHWRSLSKGLHLPIQIAYRQPLFLCHQKGLWTQTCLRLPCFKWCHCQKCHPAPTHPWTYRQTSGIPLLYQIRHTMGLQQHTHQRRQQMESHFQMLPWPFWTPSNLWMTFFLTSLIRTIWSFILMTYSSSMTILQTCTH